MNIYTKTGDKGETSLFGGKRVPKNHERIEAYGTCDELNSFLGRVKDEIEQKCGIDFQLISEIQSCIFSIGAHLANEDTQSKFLPDLDNGLINSLEKRIDAIQNQLDPLKNFVLPGGCAEASMVHISRTVCRRAERKLIGFNEEVIPNLLFMIQVLNRTSDYLFVLARYVTKEYGGKEQKWIPANK